MKKILFIFVCITVFLCGCSQQLSKAEPFYTETGTVAEFNTQYKYYFHDEPVIYCEWTNNFGTGEDINFHDTFELHVLGDDGEWYVVEKGDDVFFNEDYCHFVEDGLKSRASYNIRLFTDKLKEGSTYRISTYYFDENDNYYQVYAEFICDNDLAEEELLEISGGMADRREELTPGGELTAIPTN